MYRRLTITGTKTSLGRTWTWRTSLVGQIGHGSGEEDRCIVLDSGLYDWHEARHIALRKTGIGRPA